MDFKYELCKDILYQIDYQDALRRQVVDIPESEMIKELEKVPTRLLLAWYMAYIHFRRELLFAGYELNGFKVLALPFDAINELIQRDGHFNIHEYIF